MEKTHAEYLRANIAMKFVELHVKAGECNATYAQMIEKADNFIAELERTAKVQACIIEERDQLQARVRESEHANGVFAQTVDALVARCEKAEARVKELEAENQSLERAADVLSEDRDAYHDHADRLVTAIERHLGIECGEHSNANCPWDNAVEFLDSVRPLEEVKKERDALQSHLSAIDAMRDSKEAQP